jgi:hypothetical protein
VGIYQVDNYGIALVKLVYKIVGKRNHIKLQSFLQRKNNQREKDNKS